MSKFTSAPWRISRRSKNATGSLQVAITDSYGAVAWCVERPPQFGSADANSALLAAAPDMYAALKKLEELFAIQGDKVREGLCIRATLKAEGGSL
jgi:hypothetical protein